MLAHRNVLKIVFEIAEEGLFSSLPAAILCFQKNTVNSS
jgi:hypothetical protein